MQQSLLSVLIFSPLVALLFFPFLPAENAALHRKISLLVLAFQAIVVGVICSQYDGQGGLQFVVKVPWIVMNLDSLGTLKAEYFVGLDGLNLPLVCLTVFVMLIATLCSWRVTKSPRGYFALLLLLNTAILGSFTALDFLLFYLFFEFMLLPMFFLIGIWGGPRREYASIKFFLYTLLGSILILAVMIVLYISYFDRAEGVRTFSILHMAVPDNMTADSLLDPANQGQPFAGSLRLWAFMFLFFGFAIKLPAVPLHTWLPDAHVEASTPISVILAALLLKIGGYGLLRIAYPIFPDAAMSMSMLVGLFGVVSIIYGAFNALGSKDLKRLIAYSSVSHMGFVLLGLASVTTEGITGAVYQMVSHGIITSMLFILAGVLYDRTQNRTISDYSGLAGRMPVFFVFVLIAFFASMGLPGFSGFIAEIMILLGAFKSGSENGLLHQSLAIVSLAGLVLSAAYYLWTLQRMFFGVFHFKGDNPGALLPDLHQREKVVLFPLAAATLIFGIFPQPLLSWINPFAEQFVKVTLQTGLNLVANP